MSLFGTFETCQLTLMMSVHQGRPEVADRLPKWRFCSFETHRMRRAMSEFEGKAENICSHRVLLSLARRDVWLCCGIRSLSEAGSTGRCNTFRELVCWGLIQQGLSGPFIELPCYRAEFGLAV